MKENRTQGSLTLEACIVVPIFVAVMLVANGLFILFMGQQVMSHTLLTAAKSLALDPYSSERVTQSGASDLAGMILDITDVVHGNYTSADKWYETHPDDLQFLAKERFSAYLRSSHSDADELLQMVGIENGVDGLDFSQSRYADGVLTLTLTYTQNYPFNAAGLASFSRTMSVQVKTFEYKALGE